MTVDRYLRHNLIDWFSQERLARTRVVVIGAGAVGNEVLKNLSLLGVGEITVFDFDRIEAHNLTRSVLFRETDIGHEKAEIAAQRASELDQNLKVTAITGDFWDHLSISELQAFDLVFCCVDNFEARIRCNTLCQIARVDLINAGIDSRFASVEQFPFSSDPRCGCFECTLPASVYGRISERYSCGHLRKLSFVEKKVPTTIITSSMAASLAVSVGLRLGSDDGPASARRFLFDSIAGSLSRVDISREEACPCCSEFSGDLTVIRCRSNVGAWTTPDDRETTVITSEPILVSHSVAGVATPVFERSSEFDSDYPATLAPDPGDVILDIRDQFTVGELTDRFADRPMPCKFAVVADGPTTFIFEFQKEQL